VIEGGWFIQKEDVPEAVIARPVKVIMVMELIRLSITNKITTIKISLFFNFI
jgi:hypothetical protein